MAKIDKAAALAAGFSDAQAAFLAKHVAPRPHGHTAAEIDVNGEALDDVLDALVEDDAEEVIDVDEEDEDEEE
jgi:hypothetical protein